MPTDVSTMHPSITLSPHERAVSMMRSASRMPPHFCSFTLMPWKPSASLGTSAAIITDSSATSGSGERWRSHFAPSTSAAGSGCSTISTPWAASHWMCSSASSGRHASLASTRTGLDVTARTAPNVSRTDWAPSFTLSTG